MPFKILTERYTVSTFQVMLPIWFKTYQWQNHAFQRKGANLLLPPATKLGQGNIFSQVSVILFRGGVGVASVHAGIPSPRDQAGTPPQDQVPPGLGRHPPGAEHTERYGQRAGGMHSTGMQSCYYGHVSRKLHEIEKISTERGSCVPSASLDPPMLYANLLHQTFSVLNDDVSQSVIFCWRTCSPIKKLWPHDFFHLTNFVK